MRGTLFVHLHDAQANRVSWLAVDGAGRPESAPQDGTLEDAAPAAQGRRAVLLVPGTEVPLMTATIPTRNRQRLRKAIPYALEDRLIDEVDSLHFAVGTRGTDGNLLVAVVAKRQMDHWLEAARAAGITPGAMVPETLAVPWQAGTWTILLNDAGCVVRTDAQRGFAGERGAARELLSMALAEAGEQAPRQLRLVVCTRDPEQNLDFAGLANGEREIIGPPCHSDTLTVLAAAYDERQALNLLQGPYDRKPDTARRWRAWRPAAALAALLIGVQIGTLLIERNRLTNESRALARQIETVYRGTFPDTRRVVNPRVQMEQHLSALKRAQGEGKDGFLDLLGRSGSILKTAGTLQLNAISYHNGRLDLDLTVANIQTLDRLKQRLQGKGIQVEIRSATAGKRNVSSRLRITGETS